MQCKIVFWKELRIRIISFELRDPDRDNSLLHSVSAEIYCHTGLGYYVYRERWCENRRVGGSGSAFSTRSNIFSYSSSSFWFWDLKTDLQKLTKSRFRISKFKYKIWFAVNLPIFYNCWKPFETINSKVFHSNSCRIETYRNYWF